MELIVSTSSNPTYHDLEFWDSLEDEIGFGIRHGAWDHFLEVFRWPGMELWDETEAD